MKITDLKVRRYKAGYDVRSQLWDLENGDGPTQIQAAYTPAGDYIGSPRDAHHLVVKRGIVPEKRSPAHSVCSVGFCAGSQEWFGWSHRAIYGFGIGAVVDKDHCAAASLPVGFTARTLEDARRIACAFAESVG